MKKNICCFTLLLIALGCDQDNPDSQQNAQQDKNVADTNKSQEKTMDTPDAGILSSFHSEDIDKIRAELRDKAVNIPDSKLDELEEKLKSNPQFSMTLSWDQRKDIIPIILAGIQRRPEQQEWLFTLIMFSPSDIRTTNQLSPQIKKELCQYTLAYFQEAYSALENSTIEMDQSISTMLLALLQGPMALNALEIGELELAKKVADQMLLNNKDLNSWNYGNVIHEANTILGHVALRQDDLDKAKSYLIKSGNTPGSPQLNSFGPSFILAKELLKKDQKDVVLEYFDLVAVFWANPDQRTNENSKKIARDHADQLLKWKQEVKEGKIPKGLQWF